MAHEFATLDSALLLDAPIIAVRKDLVSMPDDHQDYREVVEHMGAVAIVALNEKDQVALIRQYRHSVGQRLWEIPAGLLDVKDEPAFDGAQRELQEEAGLAAEDWAVLTDIVTSPGFCEEASRIYLARNLREVERMDAVGDEEADMERAWVDLGEAVDMVFSGEVVNSIAVAGILAAFAYRQGGRILRGVDAPFELRPNSIAARRPGPDLKKL
ncbi:NUDIX hydrolase [uncultured Corynebacterium sp.]|uniref:NUDIX domain-containing protein n=1 Tax=uncultured Corynebacterium sp. TaxID=159447 RepID=UPI0025E06EA0|nr:NUDIX hydrolase [uncultured Corynebacterium sp.]